jgi:CrcB protein
MAVGFTGAYTTFSTFEWEAHGLLRDGETTAGTLYLVGSVLAGLLAVRLGVALGRMM